jgi:hypothetical protein
LISSAKNEQPLRAAWTRELNKTKAIFSKACVPWNSSFVVS